MGAVTLPRDEQHIVVSNVDWDTYLLFSDRIGERNIRCNYNGVDLELMTISPEHERAKSLLARLLEALTEEMDIDIAGFGSMTCRRQDQGQGFEPDECYWIEHEPQVRGRDDIDLRRDPPPDLLLEVEMSRSFVDRLAIAARLGVPEVWRWDGETLRIMLLGSDGQYSESDRSRVLPFLPIAEFARFLHRDTIQSDTKWLRSFRAWVREQMARGWGGAAASPGA
jgi:Uma2 family endonuclease